MVDFAGQAHSHTYPHICSLLRLTPVVAPAPCLCSPLLQELGLLQPWCPGVAASTAMQRTMAVYSCQAPTIRGSSSSSSAQPGRSSSNSSAAVSGSEVLDMMGASFSAMWGAVGAAGMAPFVADRLQWGPLAAGMAAQARADLPQVGGRERGGGWMCAWPRLQHCLWLRSVQAAALPRKLRCSSTGQMCASAYSCITVKSAPHDHKAC